MYLGCFICEGNEWLGAEAHILLIDTRPGTPRKNFHLDQRKSDTCACSWIYLDVRPQRQMPAQSSPRRRRHIWHKESEFRSANNHNLPGYPTSIKQFRPLLRIADLRTIYIPSPTLISFNFPCGHHCVKMRCIMPCGVVLQTCNKIVFLPPTNITFNKMTFYRMGRNTFSVLGRSFSDKKDAIKPFYM